MSTSQVLLDDTVYDIKCKAVGKMFSLFILPCFGNILRLFQLCFKGRFSNSIIFSLKFFGLRHVVHWMNIILRDLKII